MTSRRERRTDAVRAAPRLLLRIGFVLPAVLVLAGMAALAPPAWIGLEAPPLPADSVVVDGRGDVLAYVHGPVNRIPVAFQAIAPAMLHAIVAAEDDRFWVAPALDPLSLTRALAADWRAGRVVQGGSTLTQQLVKNLYLTPSRTLGRKLVEALLAVKLALTESRADILTQYLNTVYFGHGAYGVEAAALTYFGRDADRLSTPEAALLAGLVVAPTALDPYRHPLQARARRNVVLRRMAALGYITPVEARRDEALPLRVQPAPVLGAPRAPYFVAAALATLRQKAPRVWRRLAVGGYRVVTTLDPPVEAAAEAAVARQLPAVSRSAGIPEPEAAVVGLDPSTGAVLALVGGRNYRRTPFNRAVDALRPVASTFKYFLYTTAVADGIPPSAVQVSAPVRYPAGRGRWYAPRNFGNVWHGPLTMRQAIAVSDDVVAVKWAAALGIRNVIGLARAMGVTSPLAPDLTTALGSGSESPLELARALAPLANGGYRVAPFFVRSVTDAAGRRVWVSRPVRVRVLSPQVAYVVSQLFRAPLESPDGTAHNLAAILRRPAAAKTGTSSDERDAWLAGYTPTLLGVVWVGYDDDAPLGLTGDQAAGPLWAHFMAQALAHAPRRWLPRPSGIVVRQICAGTGFLATGCCRSYSEYFIAGHVPATPGPPCTRRAGPVSGHHR